MRASMSATGSVNLIVLLLLRSPFASAGCLLWPKNLRRRRFTAPTGCAGLACELGAEPLETRKRLYCVLTRTTWKLLESRRAERDRGNTSGRFRICADKLAAFRKFCSDCAGE